MYMLKKVLAFFVAIAIVILVATVFLNVFGLNEEVKVNEPSRFMQMVNEANEAKLRNSPSPTPTTVPWPTPGYLCTSEEKCI